MSIATHPLVIGPAYDASVQLGDCSRRNVGRRTAAILLIAPVDALDDAIALEPLRQTFVALVAFEMSLLVASLLEARTIVFITAVNTISLAIAHVTPGDAKTVCMTAKLTRLVTSRVCAVGLIGQVLLAAVAISVAHPRFRNASLGDGTLEVLRTTFDRSTIVELLLIASIETVFDAVAHPMTLDAAVVVTLEVSIGTLHLAAQPPVQLVIFVRSIATVGLAIAHHALIDTLRLLSTLKLSHRAERRPGVGTIRVASPLVVVEREAIGASTDWTTDRTNQTQMIALEVGANLRLVRALLEISVDHLQVDDGSVLLQPASHCLGLQIETLDRRPSIVGNIERLPKEGHCVWMAEVRLVENLRER